jgi:hypothetical protein
MIRALTHGDLTQITKCNNGGSDTVCSNAQNYCNNNILSPLVGDHDVRPFPLLPLPFLTLRSP